MNPPTLVLLEPCFHGARYVQVGLERTSHVLVVRGPQSPPTPVVAGTKPVEVIANIQDASAVCEAISNHFSGAVPSGGVLPGSELTVLTAACVAAKFGWVGNPVAAAEAARDKRAMRARLGSGNVRCPASIACSSVTEVLDAIAAVGGYPAIIKPPDMACSLFVMLVTDEHTARQAAALVLEPRANFIPGYSTVGQVLVESYARGPEYSVELFFSEGKCLFGSVTEKHKGPLPRFIELGHVVPAPSFDGAEQIEAVAEAAAREVGIRTGPAHVEVVATPDGPSVIELAARVGGDQITTLLRLALGVDLHRLAVNQALGEPVRRVEIPQSRAAAIRFLTAGPGIVRAITGVDQARTSRGVEDVVVTVVPGQLVSALHSSTDRLGHVIAVGASAEEARENAWAGAARIAYDIVDPGEPRQ